MKINYLFQISLMVITVFILCTSGISLIEEDNNLEVSVIVMLKEETGDIDFNINTILSESASLEENKEIVKEKIKSRNKRIQDDFIQEINNNNNNRGKSSAQKISNSGSKISKESSNKPDKTISSLKINKRYNLINGLAGTMLKEEMETLRQYPSVEGVYLEHIYSIFPDGENIENDLVVNNDLSIALTTSVPAIGANQSRTTYSLTGENITVAVIDTGIDYTHPDLGACTVINSSCRTIKGYDFVNSDTNPIDDNGHGSHVAGIIGANGTVIGVAPDVKFLAYKVCNSGGSCSESNIISAVDAAVDNNTDIISLSIGGEEDPNDGQSALSLALNDAVALGTVVVIAAGNEGPSTSSISSPGDAVDVITLGNS